jgi:O-antigen ligase
MATETYPSYTSDRRPVEQSRLFLVLGILITVSVIPLAMLAALKPVAALLLFVGLAALAISAVHVQFAVLVLVASVPLEGAILINGSQTLTTTKLAGGLCFVSFMLYALTSRRRLLFDQSHVIVLGILALAIFSTLQAEEIPAAIAVTLRYLAFVALYFVASQFVADQPFQRRLAWVLAGAASLASVLSLYNFVHGSTPLATLKFADPNDLAYVIATSLPLTFWLLRERWALRPIVFAMIAITSTTLLLTLSRGALVGVGAAVVWLLLTDRRAWRILLIGGLLVGIGLAYVVKQDPSRVQTSFQAKKKVASYNVSTRLDAWNAAINLASAHPFLGVGPGNFKFKYPEVSDRPPGSFDVGVVHNTYLDLAAELGVGGMLLFFAYFAIVFARSTVAVRHGNGLPGYATAIRTSLVIAAVAGLFLSEQYYAPFWLFGGLATALWREGKLLDTTR